eukprot:6186479-Pleurochrysis_carterae.AAC.1
MESIDVVGLVDMYTASLCVLEFHITGAVSAERCDCRRALAPPRNASSHPYARTPTLHNAEPHSPQRGADSSTHPLPRSLSQAHASLPHTHNASLTRTHASAPSWRPLHVRHEAIGRIPHLSFSSLDAQAQKAARDLTRVDSILYEAARHKFVTGALEIGRRTGVPLLCDFKLGEM